MKNICFFTIADSSNMKYYEMLKNSLAKFHPEIPLILIDEAKVASYKDPHFYYRATPIIGAELLEEYKTVIKIDADTIITGNLSASWEGAFDVGCVNNSNPKEMAAYTISVLNVHPLAYLNCGFVVMKSKRFVDHWKQLCLSEHFKAYQMGEQDLLNIMVYYMNFIYDIKLLDQSDKWYGLISKGYWANVELVKTTTEGENLVLSEKLVLPRGEWPVDEDKQICAIHFAGGNDPTKAKYHTKFTPEVAKHLDKLVKP